MNHVKFEGIMPALITPFCEDNKTINEEVAREFIDYLLMQGADGFYILGGTGEGLVMGREEREVMCEVAVKHIAGRKPVICHIAAVNLEEACALAMHAERTGADAIAAMPPIFFFYDETDIFNYYKRLAECVSIPVIIYYHPSAQKEMSADLIARIYEIDNVIGVKWSSDNFFQLMKLKDKTHGEMNIINGPDELLVSGLAAGADAGIGSTYNMMLPQFIKIYKSFREGKMQQALAEQIKANRIIDILIKNELIPSVKYAVELMGYNVGEATYPMRALNMEQKAYLERSLREIGWTFDNRRI